MTARWPPRRSRSPVSASIPKSPASRSSAAALAMTSIASTTTAVVTTSSQLDTLVTSENAPARCLCSSSWLMVGTKAAVSAPSPSRRRNRLGSVKAETKAEVSALVPNTAAMRISRPSPSTRDTTVAVATTLMFFRFFDTAAARTGPRNLLHGELERAAVDGHVAELGPGGADLVGSFPLVDEVGDQRAGGRGQQMHRAGAEENRLGDKRDLVAGFLESAGGLHRDIGHQAIPVQRAFETDLQLAVANVKIGRARDEDALPGRGLGRIGGLAPGGLCRGTPRGPARADPPRAFPPPPPPHTPPPRPTFF